MAFLCLSVSFIPTPSKKRFRAVMIDDNEIPGKERHIIAQLKLEHTYNFSFMIQT